MPLVAYSDLPAFARLSSAGEEILSRSRAEHQDLRELHIGLLNMMPDAALEATERQFLRLVGACNRIAQFYVHPFTIPGVEREGAAREHVARHYKPFEQLQADGLDALIVTGANVTQADITHEGFFDPMTEVLDWAAENVCSTFCSCLSSHGAFNHFHGIVRTHLPHKQWGVYSHRIVQPDHPLFRDTNTRFDVPHSRFNDVPGEQMERAGMRVLAVSDECGVLSAASPDGVRFLYFQGHPEYDFNSLLKEYKREVFRFVQGERPDYPPFPEHYIPAAAGALLDAYREEVLHAVAHRRPPPRFPEAEVEPHIDNTWTDTAKAIFNNWLGLVYQLTDWDRKRPFMDGIDPENPLGLP